VLSGAVVQVDIFSLNIIMYELFVMNLVANIAHTTGKLDEFERYAKRVAAGHREPMRPTWPQGLRVRARWPRWHIVMANASRCGTYSLPCKVAPTVHVRMRAHRAFLLALLGKRPSALEADGTAFCTRKQHCSIRAQLGSLGQRHLGGPATRNFSAQDVIAACWDADPAKRPAAKDVVAQLDDLSKDIANMDAKNARGVVKAASADRSGGGGSGGSCCVIS
jgi:hypothetical protein